MPCNLNFNQCNLGRSFPRPIFTCRQNYLRLLTNDSPNTIVQPTIDTSFLLSSIFFQNVSAGDFVFSQVSFLRDNSIIYDNLGSFILNEGRYILSYSLGGVIPQGGTLAIGIFQDGFLMNGGQNLISGSVGTNVGLSGSLIIVVDKPSSMINFRNLLAENILINNGSITLQRV